MGWYRFVCDAHMQKVAGSRMAGWLAGLCNSLVGAGATPVNKQTGSALREMDMKPSCDSSR